MANSTPVTCYSLTCAGILFNALNCAKAFRLVTDGRKQFGVKLPSPDVPEDRSEEDRDTYRRYVRCQNNQGMREGVSLECNPMMDWVQCMCDYISVEWFGISTALAVLSAYTSFQALSDVGYAEYGPRICGLLSILYSYYRRVYIDGYKQSVDGRRGGWYPSMYIMYAQLGIIGVCSAYLVIKDAKQVKQDASVALKK